MRPVNGSTTCDGAVSVGKATVLLGAPGEVEADPAGELWCPLWQPPETDTTDPAATTAIIVRIARPVSPVDGLGLLGLIR